MTPAFAFNKTFDKTEKKWCVSPNTLADQNKYLILADTEGEANDIIEKLTNGVVSFPHIDPNGWEQLGKIGKTPIFKMKK